MATMTRRRIATATLRLAMAAVGVLLVLDLVYYAHGSLEMFPSEEEHHKVRLVTGFLALALAGAEAVLWLILRRLGRTGITPAP